MAIDLFVRLLRFTLLCSYLVIVSGCLSFVLGCGLVLNSVDISLFYSIGVYVCLI